MKNILLLLSLTIVSSLYAGGFKQESNFTSLTNVSPKDVISKYKDSTVVFFRNDSSFTAVINENGELQNINYAKELNKLESEGQIAYDKSGKLYYSKSGKLFVSEEKRNGKWSSGKPVVIKGSSVKRDKYKGSVLAYGKWSYMPKEIGRAPV